MTSTWLGSSMLTGLVATIALALSGCPNPNTYGTPRTTPKGKVQHTIAAEAYGISGTTKDTDCSGGTCTTKDEDVSSWFPSAPTYQARIGVADMADIGFRVSNLSSLGFDFKLNPVKSETFDLAIDPGVQYFWMKINDESFHVLYLHGPLLLGLNLNEKFTIVATPGVDYGWASASSSSGGDDSVVSGGGFFGRFGLGFNIRFSEKFAMHPEVTGMKAFEDTNATIFLVGIGFNIGALPVYGAEAPAAAGPEEE